MSTNYVPVTDSQRLTYRENVLLALQQKESVFESAFSYQSGLTGKLAQLVETIAAEEAIIDGPRGNDTPHIEGTSEQTWIAPRHIEWGKIIEKEDTIKKAIDLTSSYVQNGALTIKRARDLIMHEAFFSARRTGEDGLTSVSFSNPNGSVAVDYVKSGSAVNSGLTFSKIIRGQSILAAGEVDIENDPMFMAITNRQMEDLYEDVKFLSKDFRDRTVIDESNKRVIEFCNVRFLRYQRLGKSGAHRRMPLWVKSGMTFGEFSALETMLERNPNKKYRLHPYMEQWVGATRTDDQKVVEILAAEA